MVLYKRYGFFSSSPFISYFEWDAVLLEVYYFYTASNMHAEVCLSVIYALQGDFRNACAPLETQGY